MPGHDDAAAEPPVAGIQARGFSAFGFGQKILDNGKAVRIQSSPIFQHG